MPNIFDASKKTVPKSKKAKLQPKLSTAKVAATKKREFPRRHVNDYSEVMKAESPFSGFLAAFMPKPVAIQFDNQDRTEDIILLLRQHPITQLKKLLIVSLSFFVPFLTQKAGIFNFLPANYQLAAFILWYLLVFGFLLEIFLIWFFSVYIITDERIIDVDFLSLIYKNISAAKIDKIEDVTAITGGALQSVINYGTVKIQTAGAKTELAFENIPQPAKVTKLLNELILEEEQEKIEGRVY